jgi:hypothetical protein
VHHVYPAVVDRTDRAYICGNQQILRGLVDIFTKEHVFYLAMFFSTLKKAPAFQIASFN